MTDSDSRRSEPKILKKYAAGRVRTSVRQREALMDQYERSGLTGPKFAEVAGVCYQPFAGWMQMRRRARGDCASSTVMAPSAQQPAAGPALIRWVEAEAEAGGGGDPSRREREKAGAAGLVVMLARRVFGTSSEKLDPAQMQLLLEGLEEIAAVEAQPPEPMPLPPAESGKTSAERAARRPRLPEHLPVKETILDPEVVQAQPENWIRIGEEVSEQLDCTPASFVRLRLVRPKYVSKERRDLPPVIAPLPPSLQERCLAAPSLLAHCMVSRYRDHLPWHRLEQIYAGLGVELSRQTLCNWSGMAAGAVQLVVKQIAEDVFSGGYVQIDETPVEYLSPGNGKTKNGYLWVVHNPGTKTVVFHWRTGRAAQCLHEIVPAGFTGIIQCDGYSAYNSFAHSPERKGSLRLAGCWAHVRRRFFEAREYSRDAAWVLERIQKLYAVEERMRESRAGKRAGLWWSNSMPNSSTGNRATPTCPKA